MDFDRRRVNRRRRRLLENHGHQMGVRRGPPLELFDKPDPGALTVLPPAIGASPDDIHGVDDPPHSADGTDAQRHQDDMVRPAEVRRVRLPR
jgi:hypothetical protein